jgi:hypothetical protein
VNLDDLAKLKSQAFTKAPKEDEASTAEEDLTDALSILEDCGKFIETILIGVKLSNALKADVETLLDNVNSFMSQYIEEETP